MLADAWGTELGIPELLGMVLLGEGSRDITSDVHGMLSMGVLQEFCQNVSRHFQKILEVREFEHFWNLLYLFSSQEVGEWRN